MARHKSSTTSGSPKNSGQAAASLFRLLDKGHQPYTSLMTVGLIMGSLDQTSAHKHHCQSLLLRRMYFIIYFHRHVHVNIDYGTVATISSARAALHVCRADSVGSTRFKSTTTHDTTPPHRTRVLTGESYEKAHSLLNTLSPVLGTRMVGMYGTSSSPRSVAIFGFRCLAPQWCESSPRRLSVQRGVTCDYF